MKELKETLSVIFNWFGNGKKCILGVLFLIVGCAIQSFSTKTLDQTAFVFLMAGAMCFVNALFSKISKTNINILLYLLINTFVFEIGIYVTSGGFTENTDSSNSTSFDSMTAVAIWLVCFVVVWIFQTLLLKKCEGAKKVVLAFFETLLSGVAALVAFLVPIVIECLK